MQSTQTPVDETWLAEQLAAKLKLLETVTTTAAVAAFDVRVSVVDLNARASGLGLAAVEQGIAWVLQQELQVVIKSLIAQKRHDVDEARKALLDYQFKALQPAADTPLATHDVQPTQDDAHPGVSGTNGGGVQLYPHPNYETIAVDLTAAEADADTHESWIKL